MFCCSPSPINIDRIIGGFIDDCFICSSVPFSSSSVPPPFPGMLSFHFPYFPLPIPFGVDLAREWIFVAERYRIEHQDLCGQDDAGGASVQQGRAQEAHRAAVIHWRAREVEGETGDGGVHEDAEVVAQIGARDAERVGAAQHE